MKKIFTTILLSSATLFVYSQSLDLLDENDNVVNTTIIDINIAPSSSHTEEIFVTNITAATKSFKVRRTILSVDAGDGTQFCWGGLCYGFTTDVSSQTLMVNPGDTAGFVDGGFHALFNSGPAMVTRMVHYQFYDIANLNDTSGVILRYNAVVGINEQDKANGTISNAYPNPASSFVSIKYDMNEFAQNGSIVIHDMLGKKIKEVELTDKQGVTKVSVSELFPGIYFYTFMVNDKAIATKKLVISSK